MKKLAVRIESISIHNFKNVVNGSISFTNPRKPYQASILGLYGQNGSGKTALIDAIELLRLAICGQTIPSNYSDYINVDASSANLKFVFKMTGEEGKYTVCYEFSLKKGVARNISNMNLQDTTEETNQVILFDELLSYSFESDTEKVRMASLIDTRTANVFLPKSKYELLVGDEKTIEVNLLVVKKLAEATSRSFIFSRELLTTIRADSTKKSADPAAKRHLSVIESMVYYGNFELFVIQTANSGLISMNALPLSFRYEDHSESRRIGAIGNMLIPLNEPSTLPQEILDIAKKVISNLNIVLSEMIPGLTISIRELGQQVMKNGEIGVQIQLMSHKNSKEIALQYESDGIKKIISVLQLLIVAFNNPSITVAIDELDSGIFEYLLGEVLKIIAEKGKGQLIFTSHNLRPLETLDKGFIAFTTTNPSQRYIRMTNVKENNNLRDFYYRDIVLGEQSEIVYEPTNNYEIALAFREAGESHGS